MSFDASTITAIAALGQAGAQIGTGVAARDAARGQAREARRRGAVVAEDERRKGRRLAGKQRALFAKGGVEIDEGTPLDVLAQTAADAELNALRAAFSFEQQAEDFKSAGRVALTQGLLGAGGTILGQAQSFADFAAGFKGSKPGPAPSGSVRAPSGSHRTPGAAAV